MDEAVLEKGVLGGKEGLKNGVYCMCTGTKLLDGDWYSGTRWRGIQLRQQWQLMDR